MPNVLKRNNVTILDAPGAKNTIIFAHGFGTDQTAWKEVASVFAGDNRIVMYDNAGGGKADPAAFSPHKYDSLHTYADDLLDICKTLEIKDAIVIAHSVSGMISVLAAIKNPEYFSKMVLVGASARYLNDIGYTGGFSQEDLNSFYDTMNTNYYAWVSGFAPAAMANPEKPQLAESFANGLLAIRPDIAQAVARVIFQSDHRKDLQDLGIETLLLQTRHDIAVPIQAAEYLNNNIRNSKLRIVDAEGHFPHISAPQEVIAAIKTFL